MDVTSDEDFLTQLSLDLDIPLYLNPGEDELSLLNSHFDKSPQEILSEIASPPYSMEDYSKEDIDLKNTEFSTTYNSTALPDYQSEIKSEVVNSPSKKSISPDHSDVIIKDEINITTPPLSPTSVVINHTGIKNLSNKIIYNQPVKIITSHCTNLSTIPPKQVPIVPKTQLSLSKNQNKVVILNTDIKPVITSPQTTKVLVVENLNLTQTISPMNVEPTTTSVNVVPNIMVNAVNRFSSTTIDPRILKKQQRKIKNRESASLSRKRKKDYMTSLEEKVKELSAENKRLHVVRL